MLLSLVVAAAAALPPPRPLTVAVDSARHRIVIKAGPYSAPAMPHVDEQALMDHGMAQDTPLERFELPVDGWLRGAAIQLSDERGNPVERRVLHHLIVVNLARRMLLYPAYERIFGAGSETDDINLPRTVGVPVAAGLPLGIYLGWHNETGRSLDQVYLTLTLTWSPRTQVPAPISVLPIYMDVNFHVAGSNTFDIPPGRMEKSWEFTLPAGGRLLGVGGHLHDYGESVRLEDGESGKVLTSIRARRDRHGRVLSVGRNLFGIAGDGLPMMAGRRYRVVGRYDNPTGAVRTRGAMAHMVGLFAPEDIRRWPAVDLDELEPDLVALLSPVPGEHGAHQHPPPGSR